MRYAILLVPLLVLLLVACNGGGEPQPTVSVSPSPAVEQPSPTPEPTPTPTPEPAVQRIAYIGADGDIWVINADGTGQQKLFDLDAPPATVSSLQWAPDGSRLATASNGVVYVASPEGQLLLEVPGVAFLAWTPKGDRFSVARQGPGWDFTIVVLDLAGDTIAEFPSGGYAASSFSADGQRYAYLDPVGEGGICGKLIGVLAEIQTSKTRPIDPDEEPVECGGGTPLFSPTDPALLGYGDRLFHLTSGQEGSLPGEAISWSPDGGLLLVIGLQTGCQRAYIYNIDREGPVLEFEVRPPGIGIPCMALIHDLSAWSPDSRYVVTVDASGEPGEPAVHIRNLATGDDKAISDTGGYLPQVSPDGQYLLFQEGRPGAVSPLWVLDFDSSGARQFAEGSAPAWQPQPTP